MTYYMLLFLVLYVGLSLTALSVKKAQNFFRSTLRFTIAGLLAIALNATSLLTTAEYTQFSTRGKNG